MPYTANSRTAPIAQGIAAALAFVAAESSAAVVEFDLDPVISSGPGMAVALSFNPVTSAAVNGYAAAPFYLSACFGSLSLFGQGVASPDANQLFQIGLLKRNDDYQTIPLAGGTTITALAPAGMEWLDTAPTGGISDTGLYGLESGLLFDDTVQYLGFRFKATSGNDWSYGYLAVSQIYASNQTTLTLHGFAYEDSGAAIVVPGAVPEPSAFAMLGGACALAFAATRRRRRAA